jgi:hypothetical protein
MPHPSPREAARFIAAQLADLRAMPMVAARSTLAYLLTLAEEQARRDASKSERR